MLPAWCLQSDVNVCVGGGVYRFQDINSGLIGLLLGVALLLPPLLLYSAAWLCLWVVDSTRTLPPAVPSPAQAKKDN